MQTGYLRAFFERSSAAVLIFSLGVALGVVSFMQAPRAHAALGNDIVCFVYSTLNGVGTPIPVLNADGCSGTPTPSTGSLKVIKVVSGGTAVPANFSLHVKHPSTDISGSPQPGSSVGTVYDGLAPGTYVVSEDAASNYTASFSGSCPAGVINVAASTTVTCTVTNTFTGGGGGGGTTTPENTLALCSDGIDNNGNGLIDLADPDCAAFKPKLTVTVNVSGGTLTSGSFPIFLDGSGITSGSATTTTVGSHTVTVTGTSTYALSFAGDCNSSGQVTLAIGDNKSCTVTETFTSGGGGNGGGGSGSVPQCRDGIDNDGDGLIDSADPGCHTDFNANNPASYDQNGTNEAATAPSGGGGGGTGSGSNVVTVPPGGGGGNGPISTLVPQNGVVLGTSTESCGPLLTTYMRLGMKNDTSEVKKLQTFLNNLMNAKLPVSGVFGSLTDKAVRSFQLKYHDDVLTPWVRYGLPSDQTSTGYVYKTTQRMINNLYCSTLNLALPTLP